jgi:hypothetical protein
MNMATFIAVLSTAVFVLGLVIFRLLWVAPALGRLPYLPKSWRRWILGEHKDHSN